MGILSQALQNNTFEAPTQFAIYKGIAKQNEEVLNAREDLNLATKIIKSYETFSAGPYEDGDALSIGYGWHSGVSQEDFVDRNTAELLLRLHIEDSADFLLKNVKEPLTEKQRAAILSLIYNVGITRFKVSDAFKALQEGDFNTFIEEAFSKEKGFVKFEGHFSQGLYNRRQKEQKLFEEDMADDKKDISLAPTPGSGKPGTIDKRLENNNNSAPMKLAIGDMVEVDNGFIAEIVSGPSAS